MTSEIKFRSDMLVEVVDSMGSDETVARAARVSTGRDQLDQGKIEGLISYLVREGHTSTLEHCYVTFRMEVPLFVREQIMTHRTLSKNNQSGRYTEFEPEFYVPNESRPLVNTGTSARPNLQPSDKIVRKGEFGFPEEGVSLHDFTVYATRQLAESSWTVYQHLIEDGVANEVARNVLPVSTYTSLWVTGNLHAWFNFLRLRNGFEGHPQYEIQEVSRLVEGYISMLYPITYSAWRNK